MGICNSNEGNEKSVEEFLSSEVIKYQYEFACLNLSEEDLKRFIIKFVSIDKNKNKVIESEELFQHFGIGKSRFAKRVFNYYDIDQSGWNTLSFFL